MFASDLHGSAARWRTLLDRVSDERPDAVLLGGDIMPSGLVVAAAGPHPADFVDRFLAGELVRLRSQLGPAYPRVLLILGNDDPAAALPAIDRGEREGLWEHVHGRLVRLAGYTVMGYAFSPPSPFLLKDWERYDVSRYLEPGCVAPEDGLHTREESRAEARTATIGRDLARLGRHAASRLVTLFHAPPHGTVLDRAELDGMHCDGVAVDVHVGSVAVRRFIEQRQPWLSLHGHVHESVALTGAWRDRIGRTPVLSAAHDGPELALVRLDLDHPDDAVRELC